MPSVETGIALGFIFHGDAGLVESGVRGVFEGSSSEALVMSHSTVADKLNLGYTRDGLEVWVKDRLACGLGLVVSVTITLGLRIESLKGCDGEVTESGKAMQGERPDYLCERILLFWGESDVAEQEGTVLVDATS